MITQIERREAAVKALIYPTLYVLVFISLDFARDNEISTSIWLYIAAWIVLFVRDFFRERRKMLSTK